MKTLFAVAICCFISINLFGQGFKQTSRSEKIASYETGNYTLYKHTADTVTVYSFMFRDQKYSRKDFLQVKVGSQKEMIDFLENVLKTMETMKKGDKFDLGLPEGNKGFYVSIMGIKGFGITVGDIGEFGVLSKSVTQKMLKDMQDLQ